MIDDIIDTGRTLGAAVRALRDAEVRAIRAVATHPVLSPGTLEQVRGMGLGRAAGDRHGALARRRAAGVRVVSCADLLADTIHRIFTDDSVAEAFGGDNSSRSPVDARAS